MLIFQIIFSLRLFLLTLQYESKKKNRFPREKCNNALFIEAGKIVIGVVKTLILVPAFPLKNFFLISEFPNSAQNALIN